MIKKIISLTVSMVFILSLVSCSAMESGQSAGEESSTAEISEPESITESITEETAESETETAKTGKIYLDATDEDFNKLFGFFDELMVCHFWQHGFDCKKSSFSYDIPAIKELVRNLYGEQEDNITYGLSPFPEYFKGIRMYFVDYSADRESIMREMRKVYDPLFKFVDYEDSEYTISLYNMFYFSIDSETVEWIESELFGGIPDRDNLVSDKETGISCYYCDGRYYFQDPGEYGGEGHNFKIIDKTREKDGRYTVNFKVKWGSESTWDRETVKMVIGLIEKDNEKYWKIFSIDWDIMKLLFDQD